MARAEERGRKRRIDDICGSCEVPDSWRDIILCLTGKCYVYDFEWPNSTTTERCSQLRRERVFETMGICKRHFDNGHFSNHEHIVRLI
jgi:hypothetical protein